jgi:hypothetical protein
MSNKSRRLLYNLLSEAVILEQEDADKEKPKEDSPETGPASILKGITDNKLGQGRPPSHVTDTREMAADPTRAKELLKKLGVPSGGLGSEVIAAVEKLYTAAAKHRDYGQLVNSVSKVSNANSSKSGIKIEVASGPMGQDAKAVYFFLRSLFTAAVNAASLNVSSTEQKQMRLEKAESVQNTFVFYQGKNAKSWN